jgi:hypothetical protein
MSDKGIMTRFLSVLTWLAIFCVAQSRGSVQARSCARWSIWFGNRCHLRGSELVGGGRSKFVDIICTHGFEFDLGVSYVVFATWRPLETSLLPAH